MPHHLDLRVSMILVALVTLAGCGGSTSSGDAPEGGVTTGGSGGGGVNTTCPKSTVTFQMIPWHPEGGAPADYCTGMGCGGTWLSIKTAAGEELDRSFFCGVTCSDCLAKACPPIACILPDHLKAEGATESWNGTYFFSSTCGGSMHCSQPACVEAGAHLIATMCAYPSTDPDAGFGCMSSTTPNCVDVPFDYPAAAPVVGIINPTR
jgi:hypothetical protein